MSYSRVFVVLAMSGLLCAGMSAASATQEPTCPKTDKWSTYCDASRSQGDKDVLDIFYDREGSLYPNAVVHVDTKKMVTWRFKDTDNRGTLRAYFQREAARDPAVSQMLAQDAGATLSEPLGNGQQDPAWQQLQKAYRVQIADKIKERAKGRPVVFIVQGYRNDYDDARNWYLPLDDLINKHASIDPFIVHVYWDGFTGIRLLTLWRYAQFSMADVGLEFRRLLNEVDTEIPVRFITHSTGAPLIANALGDASQAFRDANGKPRDDSDPYFARAAGGVDGLWTQAPTQSHVGRTCVGAPSPQQQPLIHSNSMTLIETITRRAWLWR